jgi:hypothetical protein
MEKKQLKKLIEDLGGKEVVKSAVGCGDSGMYSVISRGHFSVSWYIKLAPLAASKNVALPTSAFEKPQLEEPAE